MYNKYYYDSSKDSNMNINLNIIDCFENVLYDNDICDNINFNFIKNNDESINNESEENKKLNNNNVQLYKNNNNGRNKKYDNPIKKYENTKNRTIYFTKTSREFIENRFIPNKISKSKKFRNKYTKTS